MVLPAELSALLNAADPKAREESWARFVEVHTRLVLHVARSVARDHDAAMDAYAYVLEQLRADDFRRLRAYVNDGRGKFTTWLVVVVRRLCLDEARRRYGRAPAEGERGRDAHVTRRRLVDHVAEDLDVSEIADPSEQSVDARLSADEVKSALAAAISALEPRDRLLLSLRFEEDLSAREIAPLLHLPTPFHVYRRLNAVLDELRRALARRGVHEADT